MTEAPACPLFIYLFNIPRVICISGECVFTPRAQNKCLFRLWKTNKRGVWQLALGGENFPECDALFETRLTEKDPAFFMNSLILRRGIVLGPSKDAGCARTRARFNGVTMRRGASAETGSCLQHYFHGCERFERTRVSAAVAGVCQRTNSTGGK